MMVNAAHYRKVIHEFCDIAGLKDPVGLIENGHLHVDGFDMLLFYDEEFDPERLQIRIDLQSPPKSEKLPEALLAALLVANYVNGMGGLLVFGVNPQDGHVVLTAQQNMDDKTTGQDVLNALRAVTSHTRQLWQQICDQVFSMDRGAALSNLKKL